MVFDAHDWAFAFFRGACTRGIYDNMKTAVDAILVGKDRRDQGAAIAAGDFPVRVFQHGSALQPLSLRF